MFSPVYAHDSEGEDAGEPVNGRGNVEEFAHEVAEHPLAQDKRHHEEGQPNEEAEIRHCQVEDVHVGHRLHLGVPGKQSKEET